MDYNNRKILTRKTVQLSAFPELAQDISNLSLFGVNFKEGSAPVTNGEFKKFYVSVEKGFDMAKANTFLKFFQLPKEESCEKNCKTCITKSTCIICKLGYYLSRNGGCKKKLVAPQYNYLILKDSNLKKSTNFVINANAFVEAKSINVGFYMRRNFLESNFEKPKKIVSYGALSIFLEATEIKDILTFQLDGNTETLKMEFDYSLYWWKIAFNITPDGLKTLVTVNNNTKDGSLAFSNRQWSNTKHISFNLNNYIVGISRVMLFSSDNLSNLPLSAPLNNECPYDCNNCVNGVCKSCYYKGLINSRTCYPHAIFLWNTEITPKSGVENIALSDYLDSNKVYRSNKFAITFQFQRSTTKSARETLVRINNLPTTGSKSIQENMIVLDYEAPDTFYVVYNNRDNYSYNKSPQETIVKLKVPPQNEQFFVLLNYDGYNDIVSLFVANSNQYTLQEKINLTSSEYLTNNGYIHIGDSKTSVSTVFKSMRFYYDSVKDKNWFIKKIAAYTALIQPSCKNGTNTFCKTCQSGFLYNNICLPSYGDLFFSKNTIQAIEEDKTQSLKLKGTKSLSSFTLSFWYRRSSYDSSPSGLFNLFDNSKSGSKSLISAMIEQNSLTVSSFAGNSNEITVNKVYDNSKEKFDWIYLVFKYDIVNNELSVNLTSGANKPRGDEQKKTSTSKNQVYSVSGNLELQFGFGMDRAYFPSFDISNVVFSPNYLYTNNQITSFTPLKPRDCYVPCASSCSEDHVCPKKDRLTSPIKLSNVFLNNENLKSLTQDKAFAKLPAFRSIQSQKKELFKSITFNFYQVSLLINVNKLMTSKYTANKHTYFAITNMQDAAEFTMGSQISDDTLQFAALSIYEFEGTLKLSIGSNYFENTSNTIDINLNNRSLFNYELVYILLHVDTIGNEINLTVMADDIETSYKLKTPFLPGFLKSNSLAYTHPDLQDASLSLYNPRIFNSLSRFTKKTGNWYKVSKSNLCNKSDEEPVCSKCVFSVETNYLSCLKCSEGYSKFQDTCLETKQTKYSWRK